MRNVRYIIKLIKKRIEEHKEVEQLRNNNNIPIILIHGLFKSANDMKPLKKLLQQLLPDTLVFNLEIQLGAASTVVSNYNQYLQSAAEKIKKAVGENQKEIRIISHSQGSAVTRCYIQLYEKQGYPKVVEWYSLAGVCNGYYLPEEQNKVIPENLKVTGEVVNKLLSPKILYNQQISKILTPVFQWRDLSTKEAIERYRKSNSPFVRMNGENNINHIGEGREEFLQLRRLVTFSSPEDEVISPWITSRFGFYQPLCGTQLQQPEDTLEYMYDSFGLKTLKESGRWIDVQLENYKHRDYVENKVEEFFDKYLKQYFISQDNQ